MYYPSRSILLTLHILNILEENLKSKMDIFTLPHLIMHKKGIQFGYQES